MAKKRKKKFIQGAIKHPGSLTAQAKRAGKSLSAFIAHPPAGISRTTKRRIALAKTLRKLARRQKKKR